ncbi:MAG: putative enoyl-CoA hydratase [Ilumatobacteraceae bacterium]|nr:putative enoyl-CoA hydratase [Ilumatobacteraceae bacterium]
MAYEQTLAERRGDILLLTLNRPERLNAWTPKMSAELTEQINAANEDASIGAIVVTGAGRGFCAGADIGGQFASNLESPAPSTEPPAAPPAERAQGSDWVRLCRSSKPLVAAINGPAIGIGLTLVLPFDYLVAAAGAKISARFVKMGLVPELGSSHFLVSRCGFGNASYLALSGATLIAEDAAEIGLVDRVVTPDRVVDEALQVAGEFAQNPPPQLRMIKELLTQNAAETDLDLVQRREGAALAVAYRTPEHHEAVRAFLEKRTPTFR